jgi:hypothetical protein
MRCLRDAGTGRLNAPTVEMQGRQRYRDGEMGRNLGNLWQWLRDPQHRTTVVGWLGSATVVIVGGAWGIFTYVRPADHANEQNPKVEAHQGVAVGRDLNTGGGGINIGTSPPTLPSKPPASGQ